MDLAGMASMLYSIHTRFARPASRGGDRRPQRDRRVVFDDINVNWCVFYSVDMDDW